MKAYYTFREDEAEYIIVGITPARIDSDGV